MSQVKCVVFDWDGTVMDSTPRIISSMRKAAHNTGLAIPSEEAVADIIGLSLQIAIDQIFPPRSQQQNDALLAEYARQFKTEDDTPTPLFDGIEELLISIRSKGANTSIATGKGRPGLDRVLNISQIAHLFDYSIAADEAESKPHPDMLHKTMRHFSLDTNQLIMIGDTTHDINMANNAEVASVAVTFGAHKVEKLKTAKPHHIVTDINELFKILDRVTG
jgi:phosphoglycolate phosphatase